MTTTEFNTRLLNLEQTLEKFALRLTLTKADAKDLVQETFLKVLKNKDKFVNNQNFKAWTFTIMRNTFINNYRRDYRANKWNDPSSEVNILNRSRNPGSDDPDSAYSVMEINEKIEKLKDLYRIPFKMHVNGYKYKEIAHKLNLNIGTVKSRIYLSRKQLIDQLNK